MTLYKVLVEFELDPTEYVAKAIMDGKEEAAETMPDTLEAAQELVKKMFAGEVDICAARIISGLVCLFKGYGKVSNTQRHQQILVATVGAIQRFIMEKPFQKVTGPLSIIAQPPRIGSDEYVISVWRQAGSDLVVDSEPLITDAASF